MWWYKLEPPPSTYARPVQVAQMVTPVDSWLNSLELVDNQAVPFLIMKRQLTDPMTFPLVFRFLSGRADLGYIGTTTNCEEPGSSSNCPVAPSQRIVNPSLYR